MSKESMNTTGTKEEYDLNTEMNQMFIDDLRTGRRNYLILFVLLVIVDIYWIFLMSADSGHGTAVLIGHGIISISFFLVFIKATSVVIDPPRWLLLLLIIVALRVPFVMLVSIIILDILVVRKVKSLKKEIAECKS